MLKKIFHKYLELATERNFTTAQVILGLLYAQGGKGVKKDMQEAREWWKKAAEKWQ